jgi:hypothetical protein
MRNPATRAIGVLIQFFETNPIEGSYKRLDASFADYLH